MSSIPKHLKLAYEIILCASSEIKIPVAVCIDVYEEHLHRS